MADTSAPATSPGVARRRPKGRSVVVAAGLTAALASIGLAIVLTSKSSSPSGPRLSTAAQLEASAKAVAARHPEMKTGLEPLSAEELGDAAAREYAASGVWVLDPVGVSTTDRPTVRWIRVAGATAYEAQIESDGKSLFAATTTDDHLAFPARLDPLAIGTTYVVRVRVRVADPKPPQGEAFGSGSFTVLPVPRRAAWRTLVGDAESNEPASVRDLLVAHWAMRWNLFGEALRRADAWSTAHPGDADARPLLEALARVYRLDGAPAPYAGFERR